MEILCTRPGCPKPLNIFPDLDDPTNFKTVQQKYCISCGMPLMLVARYLPLSLLGRGGFGAAFLARDRYTPNKRKCVVKQFLPSGDLSPKQMELAQSLFEREGEVLEDLGIHAQIPDLYAFFEMTVPSLQGGKEDKFFYLVQEFIDGKTLEQELAEKGKFTQADILEVLRAILPVLKFVHDKGSIHRDIKPSNIMRDRTGLIYLLDFGAVKQIAKGTHKGNSTGIYSMGFSPPEQMVGGQIYPSTDLYALAVTCLELLTGKPPTELFDSYQNGWQWRQYTQVSDRLASIFDKMLLSAPNQRFQSVDELLAAFATKPPPHPTPSIQSQAVTPPVVLPSPPLPVLTQQFSLLEILGSAAFTGFMGGLSLVVLGSFMSSIPITLGIWATILCGLVFLQYRRIIEGKDLPVFAIIVLGIAFFLVKSQFPTVLFAAIVVSAGTVAVTALFRLVYQLLSHFLN